MKIITFDTEEHVLNDFEILNQTQRGGPQALLELAKGGPQQKF